MKKFENKKLILFDLDGTLVDTAPDISASLNFALEQDGLDCVSEALTRHWVGHGSKVLISKALAHLKATRDPEPLLKNFIDYYQNNIAVNSAPYPGVTDTLKTLIIIITDVINSHHHYPYFACHLQVPKIR